MAWNKLIGPLAITSRRRAVASALMYGLSLTVRFTSPTGEETENPVHVSQGMHPVSAIMLSDAGQIFRNFPAKAAHSIVFQRGRPFNPGSCRAGCERPMPMLDCSPP